MKIGLIGLPNSGKTTIFNALTRSHAETQEYSSQKLEPNIAVVEVDDPRVKKLSEIYQPKKAVFASVDFIDFVGVPKGRDKGGLFEGPAMSLVKTADALAVVARNFKNDAIESSQGKPDPMSEVDSVFDELILSDLILTETRLERIESDLKKGKKAPELATEQRVLGKVLDGLNAHTAIKELNLTPDEQKTISGFQLLTMKPLIVILNSGEDNYGQNEKLLQDISERFDTIEFAGKFEMELSALDEEEAVLFMQDLGIEESARARLTTFVYQKLGLISFFTVSKNEVHAWTVHEGETALDAAGTIHSDMERGFIRAECFTFDDLIEGGSEKGLKDRGRFRLEGKEYRVKDGDIIHIRFSV